MSNWNDGNWNGGRSADGAFDINCERALELLPRYADSELTEAQAAPLRRHLMACVGCRSVASEQRGLARWFGASRDEQVAEVPAGFAARVAEAAFAGAEHVGASDREADSGPHVHSGPQVELHGPASTARGPRPLAEAGGGLRDFVLVVTAAAAVALFSLSVAIGMRDRPSGETLSATEVPELLRMLDSNRAVTPVSTGPAVTGGGTIPTEAWRQLEPVDLDADSADEAEIDGTDADGPERQR